MIPFSSYPDFQTYCADSLELWNVINQPIDMIFADPPYFLSTGKSVSVDGVCRFDDKGEWDRARSLDEINAFNYKWLSKCREVLKPSGTIWVCGTYHNIFSVATNLQLLGFKILNIIVWQKSDPRPTLSTQYFSFTAEYIIWARKDKRTPHFFDCEKMSELNNGVRMPDVWQIPIIRPWELRCGKHPTQKPLQLLYRIILASTKEGELILDPFSGSCTTGVAANLLARRFIGFDINQDYLKIGDARKKEISDNRKAIEILEYLSYNPNQSMVMVNHTKPSTLQLMVEKGICYLRAGDTKGSLLVKPGFERLQYVLLHSNGENAQLYKLKQRGQFQIWTRDTLKEYGFNPSHAPYYIVLRFDPKRVVKITKSLNLKASHYTYVAKIKPLSDFVD